MTAFLNPRSKFQDPELIQMDNKLRGKKGDVPKAPQVVSDSSEDEGSDEDEEEEDADSDGEDEDTIGLFAVLNFIYILCPSYFYN